MHVLQKLHSFSNAVKGAQPEFKLSTLLLLSSEGHASSAAAVRCPFHKQPLTSWATAAHKAAFAEAAA